jgi:hypothetical protein
MNEHPGLLLRALEGATPLSDQIARCGCHREPFSPHLSTMQNLDAPNA